MNNLLTCVKTFLNELFIPKKFKMLKRKTLFYLIWANLN